MNILFCQPTGKNTTCSRIHDTRIDRKGKSQQKHGGIADSLVVQREILFPCVLFFACVLFYSIGFVLKIEARMDQFETL